MFAGTGEGYFREEIRGTGLPLRGGGIFVSSNEGGSWQRLPATNSPDFHWVNDLELGVDRPAPHLRRHAQRRVAIARRRSDMGAPARDQRPRRLPRSRVTARPVGGRALRLVRIVRAGDGVPVPARQRS